MLLSVSVVIKRDKHDKHDRHNRQSLIMVIWYVIQCQMYKSIQLKDINFLVRINSHILL